MAADPPGGHAARLAIAAALLSLAGCDEASTPVPAPAHSGTGAPHAMSYEVAIAIAAADRNRAVRECGARPQPERQTCITVADANWETAKVAAGDLRGDQQ
ncbi:MAG: hypothetical protein AB7T20_10960 [Steroidobacteraceae bacterium]